MVNAWIRSGRLVLYDAEGKKNCTKRAISALRFVSRGVKKWSLFGRSRGQGLVRGRMKEVASFNVDNSIICGSSFDTHSVQSLEWMFYTRIPRSLS